MPCMRSFVSATGSRRGPVRWACCGTAGPAKASITTAVSTRAVRRQTWKTTGLPFFLVARGGFELDLDLVALDADRVGADLDARVVGPGAVGEAEAPGVPRAGHGAVGDVAAAQRR